MRLASHRAAQRPRVGSRWQQCRICTPGASSAGRCRRACLAAHGRRLDEAVWRRGRPQELLHHSGQGSQYTREHFQGWLREHGITCSISHAGEVGDHSAIESFFRSMKRPSESAARPTAPGSRPVRMCATTSRVSTIRRVGIPHSDISVQYRSRKLQKLRGVY